MRPKKVPEFHPAQFPVSNHEKGLTQTVVWAHFAELLDKVSSGACTEGSAVCWPRPFSAEREIAHVFSSLYPSRSCNAQQEQAAVGLVFSPPVSQPLPG